MRAVAMMALALACGVAHAQKTTTEIGQYQLPFFKVYMRAVTSPYTQPRAEIFVTDRHVIKTNLSSASREDLVKLRELIDATLTYMDQAPPPIPIPPAKPAQ